MEMEREPFTRAVSPRRSGESRTLRTLYVHRCRYRRVELRRERGEGRRGPLPLQPVHALEQRDVGAECRQVAKQEHAIALPLQRLRERSRIRGVDAPEAPVRGN